MIYRISDLPDVCYYFIAICSFTVSLPIMRKRTMLSCVVLCILWRFHSFGFDMKCKFQFIWWLNEILSLSLSLSHLSFSWCIKCEHINCLVILKTIVVLLQEEPIMCLIHSWISRMYWLVLSNGILYLPPQKKKSNFMVLVLCIILNI